MKYLLATLLMLCSAGAHAIEYTSAGIADGSIDTAKLNTTIQAQLALAGTVAAGSVDTSKLTTDAVTGVKILNTTIDTAKLNATLQARVTGNYSNVTVRADDLHVSGTGDTAVRFEAPLPNSVALELIRTAGGGDFRFLNSAGSLYLAYGTDDTNFTSDLIAFNSDTSIVFNPNTVNTSTFTRSNGALALGGALSVASNADVSGIAIFRGANPSHAASRSLMAYSAGVSQWWSYGANASTPGEFVWAQRSSDGSLGDTAMSINSAGTLSVAGSTFTVTSAGDATLGNGLATFNNSISTSVVIKGFSRYTGPSANSGLLAIGNGAAARGFLDYDGTTNNYFTIGNTANTRVNIVLGTASTPTTPLYVDTAEIVATVPYVPPIKTKAQFDAITATRSGQVYICSDCAVPFSLCVSTGTVFPSGFRRSDSTTAGCGTNN